MKNVLFVLIILIMLGGVGATIWSLNERTNAIKAKDTANSEKEKANKDQKQAETARDTAKNTAATAISETVNTRNAIQEILGKLTGFEERVNKAEKAKAQAIQTTGEITTECNDLQQKLEAIKTEIQAILQEKQNAIGQADGAKTLQEQTEQEIVATQEKCKELEDTVAQLRGDSEKAKQIAFFVSSFTMVLFNWFEVADGNVTETLDTLRKVQTSREKSKMNVLLEDIKKKYNKAKDNIGTLSSADEATADIVKKTVGGITVKIAAIDEAIKLLQNTPENNPVPAQECDAIQRLNEEANKTMGEVCETMVNIIRNSDNISSFTLTHLNRIMSTQNKYSPQESVPFEGSEKSSQIPSIPAK